MNEAAGYMEAVHGQPANLDVAYQSVAGALANARIAPWRPGETVAVVAMGASSHSAHALVTALSGAGIRAVSLAASDIELYNTDAQPADHYVIVSESGRSPEPVSAARRLTAGRRIGVTNAPDSPLADVVDAVIPLGGFSDSGVYTIGYTATLLAYALLLDHAQVSASHNDGISGANSSFASHVDHISTRVSRSLELFDPAARILADRLASVHAIDFVGHGMSLASAAEGALLFREAVGTPTSAFDTYQYLHGPMESLDAGRGLIVFGDGRELGLIDSVCDAGVLICLVTKRPQSEIPGADHENVMVITLPDDVVGFGRSIVEVLLPQLTAGYCAQLRGRTPGQFRYRQKDTKLPSPPL